MNRAKPLLTLSALILIGSLIWVQIQKSEPQSKTPTPYPSLSFKVVNSYPHDPKAFTQGLLYHDGFLYESTGLKGQSSLRKVELETGKILRTHNLNPALFGEGLALWKEQLVQLTWHAGTAFIYDIDTFGLQRTITYSGQGWGLTSDNTSFILSDGSATLRFLDPQTFREVRRVRVTDAGLPVNHLNELEYIRGEIFANIWMENRIARIDPQSGNVISWINLNSLVPPEHRNSTEAVLNGIAYDASMDRIFVTGKRWPRLYELDIIE